jgi:dolichol-phosphate mannosyltransferase
MEGSEVKTEGGFVVEPEPRKGDERVWIVVPTLNEAENVVPLLERIQQGMGGLAYSVCIVDDGSRDGTLERVREFAFSRQTAGIHIIQREKKHLGSQRGAAVMAGFRLGLERSDADLFVEMDADLSHLPEELPWGVEAVRTGVGNVAIASKYVPGSRTVGRPWSRRAVSLLGNALARSLITPRVRDYSNGYRFYDRSCIEILCGQTLRFGSPIYLSEVLALLLARGKKVVEFPATYVGRGEGFSKLRWTDLVKAGIASLTSHCASPGPFRSGWRTGSGSIVQPGVAR